MTTVLGPYRKRPYRERFTILWKIDSVPIALIGGFWGQNPKILKPSQFIKDNEGFDLCVFQTYVTFCSKINLTSYNIHGRKIYILKVISRWIKSD